MAFTAESFARALLDAGHRRDFSALCKCGHPWDDHDPFNTSDWGCFGEICMAPDGCSCNTFDPPDLTKPESVI